MAKYRKKPVIIEAEQWFKLGDAGTTEAFCPDDANVQTLNTPCKYCGKALKLHGYIDTLEGGHMVCPGDWIITGIKGERYPCKPDIFKQTYEKVGK